MSSASRPSGIAGKSWKESSLFVEQKFVELESGLKAANGKLDDLVQFKTVIETLDKQRQKAVSTVTKVVVPVIAAITTIVITVVTKLIFGD